MEKIIEENIKMQEDQMKLPVTPLVFENEIDYIVWDLETTGFVAPECKILEIGCLIVRGDQVESKHWVLDNKVEIPAVITEITGITKEIIEAEGRDPVECLKEFLPLFEKCKRNITHNGIRFDIPFLVETVNQLFSYTQDQKMAITNLIRSTAYDTAVNFKASKLDIVPEWRETYLKFADRVMNYQIKGLRYSLALAVAEYGINLGEKAHRAMADVRMTHEVYKKLNNL